MGVSSQYEASRTGHDTQVLHNTYSPCPPPSRSAVTSYHHLHNAHLSKSLCIDKRSMFNVVLFRSGPRRSITVPSQTTKLDDPHQVGHGMAVFHPVKKQCTHLASRGVIAEVLLHVCLSSEETRVPSTYGITRSYQQKNHRSTMPAAQPGEEPDRTRGPHVQATRPHSHAFRSHFFHPNLNVNSPLRGPPEGTGNNQTDINLSHRPQAPMVLVSSTI